MSSHYAVRGFKIHGLGHNDLKMADLCLVLSEGPLQDDRGNSFFLEVFKQK